ncbi:unnamed protein product [Calypogeia fissa]
MQAQTHVPNPGLGSRMAQPNGNSLPIQGGGPWRKTWHTDTDVALRRTVVENILQLFQKRRGPVTAEWQQKLPDFVKRLEEALYRSAITKEEYADQNTLESRLQTVAKRMTSGNQRAPQHGSQTMSSSLGNMMPTPGSTMIPTPGGNMSVSGVVSGMIPTPGSAGTMVPTPGAVGNMIPTPGGISSMMPTPGHSNSMLPSMNNMMSSSGKVNNMMAPSGNGSMMMAPGPSMNSMFAGSGNMIPTPGSSGNSLVSQQGMGGMRMTQNGHLGMSMGMPHGGSQMIPTPGLTTAQSIGMNQASSPGLAMPNATATPLQEQSQSFTSAPNVYRNLNGQISLNNMVQQRKNVLTPANGMSNGMQMMGNNQHLMNGNAAMHNQTNYLNNQLSSMQVQAQQQQQQLQRANHQRQQQMRMQTAIPNPMVSMSESYAMNAADLAGSGSLYPPVSSGGLTTNSLSMNANGSQPAKMIPVPGLPSPMQNSSHLQQASQPQQLQRSNFAQNSSMARNQQQQQQQLQIPKSQGVYQSMSSPNLSSQKLAGSLPMDQSQQPSPTQKMPLQMNRLFDTQSPSSQLPQLQRQQPVSMQQQQLNIQSQQQQQQRQGAVQQQSTANHQQQVRQQVSQQSAVQQSRLQQPVQQRSFANAQQQHRQMPQLPQVQQDTQQQQQQQALSTPMSGQQQQSQAQAQAQVQAQTQQQPQPQPQQLASTNGQAILMQSAPQSGSTPNGSLSVGQPPSGAIDPQRAQQYSKQQRWLLFLRHASKCTASEGHCNISPHCHMARQLWTHLGACRERDCQYTRCNASRTLLHHYRICNDPRCPVCGPVKQMINHKRPQSSQSSVGQTSPANVSSPQFSMGNMGSLVPGGTLPALASTASGSLDVDLQPPPPKRVKVEPGNLSGNTATQPPQQQTSSKVQSSPQVAGQQQAPNRHLPVPKAETQSPGKPEGPGAAPLNVPKTESQILSTVTQRQTHVKVEVTTQVKVESTTVPAVKAEPPTGGFGALAPAKQETASPVPASTITNASIAKSGKPKIVGTSLTELFTPEMIREHITGLRQWVGQSKAKAEKNQAMEHQMSENACRLCAVEKLTFEPPPIYCTACGARIKRNALYYTVGSGETRHYFCIPCYNDIRTETVEMDGMSYLKSRLEKRKNDEETEEAWVQCDKCNQWNHQVCALFNGRRNEGGEAEYTCPQCCMSEIERGERKPLQSSAVLGAKDLPKTLLSEHLEIRLARKLKHERTERARALGKNFDEVPGADSLVVRVVSSVDKKLEVKQRFMEIFQEEDYPTEFPYKSKVVLLFQKIEGVEVCLFGMYVQEFGVDCQHPNQRRVYLSYLDSVKYFRPDVKTVNGEALRTYVYHEILIAYLDYCKRRGFSSCYIWACPPLKGEDYILYCHPEIQKTPKSDKLRDWYLTMLKKATSDGIVVEVTNLYDYFFVSTGECKAKVTAARLPYFDGDYWPGAAEDMIVQLQQEEEEGRKLQKKGKNKKTATKRASKSAAQAELASNASKDLQLMYKLGESILPMKEDFIMVHMHFACTHCRLFITSGYRWSCKQCKNFQLCDSCYDAEQKREERDRHPISSKEAHLLTPIQVEDIPQETKDKDEFMESEFFDTRQAFLSLCQGNHYQYDTLRRAKHSSMMVLYHLHNPTAPAFVVTCNMCTRDIETGAGWRCETCPDFDLCNGCKDLSKHPHKLTPHPSASERNAQNKEARQQRVLQLRKMLDLLVHASQCGVPQCNYPKCRSVKGLFRHGMMCKVRASGGCALCKRMWYLLQLHARACKESECRVPRCKDLKEHVRRSNQQQESRRRAAVMEMMRQRAAEAAGGSS